ncbi:MAG: zinc ribbon domain-containing protein [Oscillospiraceae bacterium]|nr:zinc ribbon domain-containing protein [Oscillospiraceae bacterium]
MSFCSNCGNHLDENAKFCSKCGSPIAAPAESTPAEPVYSAPVYTPTYNTPAVIPEVTGKTKALGFIGMGLGIGGFVFAIIGIICVLSFMWDSFFVEMAFFWSLYLSFFSMPMSIIGRILAGKSIEGGNTSGVCRAGTGLGLAGVIISCVMLFLGFISLTMA